MAPLDMHSHLLQMNQLCKVCGEPAAGYHFGAFTCEGCKSFFGRTYNNLAALGECKNSGQCVINKKNRTSCKSCRLKKCLMVGMSKSGSRYGRRSNWFKIHCLIQDQAEMTSRLADQGVLANGQLPYDAKDIVQHFRPEYSESTLPINGTSRASPSSDPGGMDTPVHYGVYAPKGPTNGFTNGYSSFDTSSPPYERKENIGFHPLPLSPVSPLHTNKFFFHPANGSFFAKNFGSLPKMFNGDFSYSPPQRLMPMNGLNPVLRAPRDGPPIATECYADIPEQDTPIDLSMKKPETPSSDETIIDDEESIKMMDDEEQDSIPVRAETPLDLTSKKSVPC